MRRLSTVIGGVAALLVWIGAAGASPVIDIYAGTQCRAMTAGRNVTDPLADPLNNWVDANREKIASLLLPEDQKRYTASTEADQCEDAEAIVARRFRAAFPEMACFFGPDHTPASDSFSTWRAIVAGAVYPGLNLCFAEMNLRESRAILAKAGIRLQPVVVPFYTGDLEREYDDLWASVMSVDIAVVSIDGLCRFDRLPCLCPAGERGCVGQEIG
jgi:hypothetical protein